MPTHPSARAIALAAIFLAACGERPPAPAAPSSAATTPPAPTATGTAPPSAPSATDAAALAATRAAATAQAAGPRAAAVGAEVTQAPASAPAPAGGQPPATDPAALPAPTAPASVTTVLREVVALEPGGSTRPLAHDGDTVVDPGAQFRVVLSISSPDARMLLLDAKDALVAAEGAHEVGQATRLTLAPSAPLTPGRRYLLRIDGASTPELHDASGRAFAATSLEIVVAGTPPPPEPKKPAPRRKRRR